MSHECCCTVVVRRRPVLTFFLAMCGRSPALYGVAVAFPSAVRWIVLRLSALLSTDPFVLRSRRSRIVRSGQHSVGIPDHVPVRATRDIRRFKSIEILPARDSSRSESVARSEFCIAASDYYNKSSNLVFIQIPSRNNSLDHQYIVSRPPIVLSSASPPTRADPLRPSRRRRLRNF